MKRIIRIVVAVSAMAALLLSMTSCVINVGTPSPTPAESTVPVETATPTPTAAPSGEPASPAPSVSPDTSGAELSLNTRIWSETLANGDVVMEYPEIVSTLAEDEQALELANGVIAAEVQDIYDDFVEDLEYNPGGFERWKLNAGYELFLTRSECISIRMTIEEYTGGNHPEVDTECFTWVRGKGFVDMDELFGLTEDKFEKAMCDSIVSQLADYPDELYEDADRLVREEFDEDMCVLDAYGVAVRFDYYDLGPYMAGMPEFVVPYDELGGTIPEWING